MRYNALGMLRGCCRGGCGGQRRGSAGDDLAVEEADVVLRGPAGQRVLKKCAHCWLSGKDQENDESRNWVEGWGVLHIWIRV